MFAFGNVEMLAAGAVALFVLVVWRLASGAAWIRVDEAYQVDLEADALEAPFTRLLSGLPASQLRMGGPGTWTLVLRRAQWWTVLPAALLFPMGLLFFLFREQADLVVTVRPAAGGAEILLIGSTRRSVADSLREACAELPRSTGVRVA